MPNGTVLMTSLQSPTTLLKDIHKKDAPYKLALIRAKASFSGLWVYKEDHTEARILGALAKIAPDVPDARRGVPGDQGDRVGLRPQGRLRPQGLRPARDAAQVKITEGNAEIPYSFEMPKWWEMREGVTIPAIPIGKPKEGGQGLRARAQPVLQEVHDAHDAAGDRLRHLREVQPLLDLSAPTPAST